MRTIPLFQTFTYAVEDGLANPIKIGSRVVVPLRKDKEVGICVGLTDISPLQRKPKGKSKVKSQRSKVKSV